MVGPTVQKSPFLACELNQIESLVKEAEIGKDFVLASENKEIIYDQGGSSNLLYDFPILTHRAKDQLTNYVNGVACSIDGKLKSTGYLRAKIFKTSIFFRVLVDSGNLLSNVIMSKKFRYSCISAGLAK